MIPIRRDTSPNLMNAFLISSPWPNETLKESQSYVTSAVSNPLNHLIISDHGGILFESLGDSIYECHTVVLPHAPKTRQKDGTFKRWALELAEAATHYLFAKTDATELRTQILDTNQKALALALAVGMQEEFYLKDSNLHVLTLNIVRWASTAPNLIEKGEWYHNRLSEIANEMGFRIPHETPREGEVHNRYVGASFFMAEGNQHQKAVNFYNQRWGKIVNDPLIEFRGGNRIFVPEVGTLIITETDFTIELIKLCL